MYDEVKTPTFMRFMNNIGSGVDVMHGLQAVPGNLNRNVQPNLLILTAYELNLQMYS